MNIEEIFFSKVNKFIEDLDEIEQLYFNDLLKIQYHKNNKIIDDLTKTNNQIEVLINKVVDELDKRTNNK